MNSYSTWVDILDYAIWAPSPHNVQPWKIKLLSETEADLYYDPARLLPIEDPQCRFLLSGFGIFLEMLDVSASAKGYKAEFEPTTLSLDINAKEISKIGKITLKQTDLTNLLDRELIKQRRTSRLPYSSQLIPQETQDELIRVAAEFNHDLTITSDPDLVKWTIELNKTTMFADMEDDAVRNEIDSWMRYSTHEAEKTKDGLWTYCMNVSSSLMKIFFKSRWIINLPIVSQLVRGYYLRLTYSPTIGWLQGPFKTQEDWLISGRMLARLWLTLTKHNIYLHPFGSIITNPESHKAMTEKLALDESDKQTWLLMRLGYSKQPPQSMRLTVKDILI